MAQSLSAAREPASSRILFLVGTDNGEAYTAASNRAGRPKGYPFDMGNSSTLSEEDTPLEISAEGRHREVTSHH